MNKQKFNIPELFSVSNGYVAYVIGQWLKHQTDIQLAGNISETQLTHNDSGFFTDGIVGISVRSGYASWQNNSRCHYHFETLAEFVDHVTPKAVEVKLNGDYTAKYIPGDHFVVVGCQNIPVAAIKELVAVIDKQR